MGGATGATDNAAAGMLDSAISSAKGQLDSAVDSAVADAALVVSDIGRFIEHQIGILVNLQHERQIYGQRLNDARHYKVLATDIGECGRTCEAIP